MIYLNILPDQGNAFIGHRDKSFFVSFSSDSDIWILFSHYAYVRQVKVDQFFNPYGCVVQYDQDDLIPYTLFRWLWCRQKAFQSSFIFNYLLLESFFHNRRYKLLQSRIRLLKHFCIIPKHLYCLVRQLSFLVIEFS